MGRMRKMRDHVERYLALRVDELKPMTYINDVSLLTRFATEWDRTRRVPTSIDEDWVREFLYNLRRGDAGGRGKPLAGSSYNAAMRRLKLFFGYLIKKEVASSDVLDALRLVATPRPEYLQLTLAQVVLMVESCEDPYERWILALASQTLGRDSELRSRRVEHFRLDTGLLAWHRQKTEATDKLSGGRDELQITFALANEWKRWALVYQDQCGNLQPEWPLIPRRRWVGEGTTGARVRYNPTAPPKSLGRIIQRHAARAAGREQVALKGQASHIMRRSMARALYEQLKAAGHYDPAAPVQAMLGHSDRKTTMQYIGVRPDREERNALLAEGNLLWTPQDNVTQLKVVNDGRS